MSEWERIDSFTDRMETPQGWIVRSQFGEYVQGIDGPQGVYGQSICFVPDPEKEWFVPTRNPVVFAKPKPRKD